MNFKNSKRLELIMDFNRCLTKLKESTKITLREFKKHIKQYTTKISRSQIYLIGITIYKANLLKLKQSPKIIAKQVN